jgi:hypothetical protein
LRRLPVGRIPPFLDDTHRSGVRLERTCHFRVRPP